MRTLPAFHFLAHGAARCVAMCALPLLASAMLVGTNLAPAAELGWSFPPEGPLRAHMVRGYSYRDYQVHETLARAGANALTESTQQSRGISEWGGTSVPDAGWLRQQPDAPGFLMNHHLVIVCNVSSKGFGKNQEVLVDFVKRGGAVLFFCGSYSFGDQSVQSPFAEMAPLEFPAEGPWKMETERVSEGLAIKPGADYGAEQLAGAEADNPPYVYSICKATVKPGAKVLLTAGDHPLLITAPFGKGQVAVFTGSCRGYPQEGQMAFWKWEGWPALMSKTVEQLTTMPDDVPRGLDAAGRQALTDASTGAFDLLDGANEEGRRQFESLLHSAAIRCHDKSTADFVLGVLAKYPLDLPSDLSRSMAGALAPWVDETSAASARAMIDSGKSGKTILGLILLGASGADGASAVLEEFHTTGTPRETAESSVSLARSDPQSVGVYIQAEENAVEIRRAAITGLALSGDQAALAMLGKAAANAAKGRYPEDAEAGVFGGVHLDYQNAVSGALLCGDAEAAGPVIDFLLVNRSVMSRPQTEASEGLDPAVAAAWQEQLHGRLARTPKSVLEALAKRIGAEEDRNVTPAALAAFGGRKLSPEVAGILAESPISAVAELGKRVLP